MDEARWQQIQDIFEGALERVPAERPAFLAGACAGNEPLLREVASLLEAHAGTGPVDRLSASLIEPLAGRVVAGMREGTRVGPFRVGAQIGQGGMGTVYVAERVDGQFEQRVALKLVRPDADAARMPARFLEERRILARLQHPNIARLLDGGLTEDGLPYFVMEYVEGQPIDRYCDARRLDVTERLRLFIVICQAVQFAHQSLVVHRDLKPGNILVTPEGRVKLLDFGIARLLAPGEGAADVEAGRLGGPAAGAPSTQTGPCAMTPEYASPEQVRGDVFTTASDVYSLGVMLYELLTGTRPYLLAGHSAGEIERIVCETQPPRPSTVVAARAVVPRVGDTAAASLGAARPERLRRRLEGDLDTIVMKALHKDPAQRYASAGHLAEDLGRHLLGFPVTARPDTPLYRTSKFVRRHRLGVGMAVLVAATLLGGVGGTAWQARRATQERDRARLEAEKAEQVAAFLAGLFRGSDPVEARGDTLTAHDLLARGATRVEQELAHQPEVQATLFDVIGEVHLNLGDPAAALRFAERALATRRRLFGPHHPDVARSLSRVADARSEEGDYPAAESLHRAALDLRRALLGPHHPDVAESMDALGDALVERGDYVAAESLFRQALDVRRARFGPAHPAVATSLNSVATALYHQGDARRAEPLFRDALAVRRAALPPLHPDVASSLNNLAVVLDELGDDEAAAGLYREAIDLRRRVLGPAHPRVAVNLSNLALLLAGLERYDEAEALYLEALSITRDAFGEVHPRVALQQNNLAKLYHDQGRLDAAERLHREALALRHKLHGRDHPDVAVSLNNLAGVLMDRDDAREAEALWREALAIRRRLLPEGHALTLGTQAHLGDCLRRQGRRREAEALLTEAYEGLKTRVGDTHPATAAAARYLAVLRKDERGD